MVRAVVDRQAKTTLQDEAIRTLPAGHSYEYACVVFTGGSHNCREVGPSMRTLRSLLKLNWLDQSQVRTTGAGSGATFTLHALGLLQPSPPGRIAAIRIPSTISQHYFLMEARLGVDPYERSTPGVSAGLPPEGVVVYEIDEAVWAPVHLRAVLSTGQSYTNQAEQLEISATAQVAGGFTVTLRSTEHPDCSAIRHQIAEAEAEIRSLQEELQHAAPGERAEILDRIREWRAIQRTAQEHGAELGCCLR